MVKLTFQTISFEEKKDVLQVNLLRNFAAEIPKTEVEKISSFEITSEHTISFADFKEEESEKLRTRFSFLLDKYFDRLKNKLTGNKTTYIHKNSGIPLIGNNAFGIVYRNSSIIEIKPVTSCNLNCIYCSVGEGLQSKKNDFVVEKDYLINELKKLIGFVGEPVEVHIGVQGEPFLYADIDNLIVDLEGMEKVSKISIDTNGTLLSHDRIDKLSVNTKLQFNFSLDAIDEKLAKKMAGVETYNVNQVKEVIAYTAEKMKLVPIIAPVYVPELNYDQLEEIIRWVKTLDRQPILGIQNYLQYKTGRNLKNSESWDDFYAMLNEFEREHQIKLILDKDFFNVRETKKLEKPFKEGEVVSAVIKCLDRFPDTVVAVSGERNISVPNVEFKEDKEIKVKILRDKHNVFTGRIV